MLSLFKRAAGSSSQIGVFVTTDGVAAAQLSNAGAKPRLERCVYERNGDTDPIARVMARLPNRRAPTVSVVDPAARARLENLSAAIEPFLIVGVGAMVLVLALSVFLPLWDMVAKGTGLG